VRNDQNARLAKLLHGSRYDDLIVLLARTAAAQLLLLSTGRWWLILLRAISSSRGSSSATAANALRRQISVIALRCSTGCLPFAGATIRIAPLCSGPRAPAKSLWVGIEVLLPHSLRQEQIPDPAN